MPKLNLEEATEKALERVWGEVEAAVESELRSYYRGSTTVEELERKLGRVVAAGVVSGLAAFAKEFHIPMGVRDAAEKDEG